MRYTVLTSWLVLLGISLCVPAAAQDSGTERTATTGRGFAGESDLPATILRLADQPPDPEATLAAARRQLQASIDRLRELLARGPAETRQGWEAWLDLAALQAEVARAEPDRAVLRSLSDRYRQDRAGLE